MVPANWLGTCSRWPATKRISRDASHSLVPTIATTAMTNRTVKYRVGIREFRGIYARIICFFPPDSGSRANPAQTGAEAGRKARRRRTAQINLIRTIALAGGLAAKLSVRPSGLPHD